MDYYKMRAEIARAAQELIEHRKEWPYGRWYQGLLHRYGVSEKLVKDILKSKGFEVRGDKVVESE